MSNCMTWQDKQEQLLAQVADICCENRIGMFLCGETALCAYRDGILSDKISVCIDARDAERFIAAVEQCAGYNVEFVLESLLNNDCYPVLELRFCDPRTTDFNIQNFNQYIYNCIHITIKFIEHIPTSRLSFAVSRMKFKNYKKNIKLPAGTTGTKQSAALFKSMIKTAAGNASRVWLNSHELDFSIFENPSKININGREYLIPGNGKNYLTKEFGKKWQYTVPYSYPEKTTRFMSCGLSWKDYKEAIKDIDFESYQRAYTEERKITALFKQEHAKIRACYDILERTYDRIYLFQKYQPKKDKLIKLDEECKLDELRDELAEYIEFIDKHYKRGLGICWDPDILEITLKLLAEDKGKKYADEVRALIPEEHLQVLRIKDYRGNYI